MSHDIQELIENVIAENAALRAELAALKAELAHWKANHANQVALTALLTQRPDLPVDRIPAYREMEILRAELAATGAKYEAVLDNYENAACRKRKLETEVSDLRNTLAAIKAQPQAFDLAGVRKAEMSIGFTKQLIHALEEIHRVAQLGATRCACEGNGVIGCFCQIAQTTLGMLAVLNSSPAAHPKVSAPTIASTTQDAGAVDQEPSGWLYGRSYYERDNPRITDDIKKFGRPQYDRPPAATSAALAQKGSTE